MALFNRSASVILKTDTEEVVISGVRIIFDCTKSSDQTKNEARIQIFNLSEKTRAKFDIKDAKITLKAGYIDESGEEVLFIGTVTQSAHKLQLPEIVTYLEVSDGYKELRNARISESLKEGTSLKQVVKVLAEATGLPIKELTSEIPEEQFSQGLSLIGPVYDLLTSIAEKAGLEWSVQNDEVQIIKKNAPTQDRAVLLTSASGLIKSPERIIKDSNKLDYSNVKKLKVESLLIPKLAPGRKVEIRSNAVEGIFRIDVVQHTGDTHGSQWNSVCEVREI